MKGAMVVVNVVVFSVFLLGCALGQENPDGTYNPKYEPYSILIKEQRYLKEFVEINTVTKEEQKELPNEEVLIAKMIVDNWNYSRKYMEVNSTETNQVKATLNEAMLKLFGNNFEFNIDKFDGHFQFVSIKEYEKKLLIYFYVAPNQDNGEIPNSVVERLNKAIDPDTFLKFGNFTVNKGKAFVVKPVEKNTVIEIALQLYKVKYPFGMDNTNSIPYRNMTDQMIHLIGTRYNNVFGENYYRFVIYQFARSKNSLIVHAAILLDPDPENFYHATKIWYSVYGYVKLGKFPLLSGNIHVIDSYMVRKERYPFLSDRSYKRPLSEEFTQDPLISITLPAFLIIAVSIITFMLTVRFCHWFAVDRFNKHKFTFI